MASPPAVRIGDFQASLGMKKGGAACSRPAFGSEDPAD
jgi:hypothetical protein